MYSRVIRKRLRYRSVPARCHGASRQHRAKGQRGDLAGHGDGELLLGRRPVCRLCPSVRPPLRPMFCRNSWMYSKRRIGSGAGCARRTRAAASDPWAPDRKIRSRYGANRDALVLRGALPPPSSGVGAPAGPPGIDLNLAVPDHHAGRTQDGFGQRSSGPTAAPPSRVMNSRRLICSHCRNHTCDRAVGGEPETGWPRCDLSCGAGGGSEIGIAPAPKPGTGAGFVSVSLLVGHFSRKA
jgi:hypothetical protein